MRRILALTCLVLSCAVCTATVVEAAGSQRTRGWVSAHADRTVTVAAPDRTPEISRSRLVRLALDLRLRTFLRLRGLPILPPSGTHQIIDNPDPIGQAPNSESGMSLFGDTPEDGTDDHDRPEDGASPPMGGIGGDGDDEDDIG